MHETRRSGYGAGNDIFGAALEGTLAALWRGGWRRRLLATTPLGLVLLMTPVAWANPTGGVVAGGDAAIHDAPGVTTIDQASQRALINWKGFGIAPGELTQFRQPSTDAIALNRVVGNETSQITGALKANGQIWLVNPNGILFGPGARIDVHGILATTTDIADHDFMAGRYDFNQPSPDRTASVVNQGAISIGEKGLGALVAPHVRNDGVIAGKLSHVVLAGAETFTLDFYGDGLVQFAATSKVKEALEEQGAIVSNDGTISAEGGTVLITAAAASDVVDEVINVSGVVEAKSVAMKDGAIVLDGGDDGIVHVAGTLDASGGAAGEKGGTVKVLGEKVGLFDGARVDASGDAGGGEALIGGNDQGKGPERNAERTVVFKKATVKADALRDGDGGRVIVWSDDYTRFDGAISARGGAEGGDGGFVEISGLDTLDFRGSADRTAPNGEAGMLLLDPNNITIWAGDPELGDDQNIAGTGTPDDPFTSTDDSAFLSVGTLQAALAEGSVTVRTGSAGESSEDGDIMIDAAIDAPDGSGNLTLEADNDIFVNAIVDFRGTPGGVAFDAGASVFIGADVSTSGGSINISSGGGSGITITGATVDAGGGNISLTGINSAGGTGIVLQPSLEIGTSALQTTGSGAITLVGTGTSGPGGVGQGIGVRNGSAIRSENGDISLTGTAGDSVSNADGISIFDGGVVEATGSGNVSLAGTAGSGAIDNQGIAIGSSDGESISRVAVSTGNVTAIGTGNGTGSDPVFGNFGVWVFDGGVIEVTGTGTISIEGTGGNNSAGIVETADVFEGGSSLISTGVGGTSLTLTADEIDFSNGAEVNGSGILQLQPLTPGLPILVGDNEDSGVGVLDVTAGELSSLADGFASITIGRDNGSGALTVAAAGVTFNDPVVLRSPDIGGSIVVNGPVQMNGNGLTLTAGSTADINADLTAFGADIAITSGGTIDTTGSFLRSLSQTGPGGDITIQAAGDITTAAISAAGSPGAGAITLSSGGSIATGTGTLDASSSAGAGGPIALTSAGDISTGVVLGSEVSGLGGQPLSANAPGVVDLVSGLTPNGADVVVGSVTRPTNILLPGSVDMEGGDASLFVANDYTLAGELLGADNILVDVEGLLTLTGRLAATSAGNSIVLDTQGFVNDFAGEGQALDPGDGRFLAYSTRRPSADDRGALDDVSDITRGTFAANPPASIAPADENFFVYPDFGTLTFVASERSIPYGDPVPFTDPPVLGADYTVAFSEGSELPEDPFSGDPVLATDAVVDALGRAASVGNFALLIGPGSLESDFTLAFENSTLMVTAAPLSIRANDASRSFSQPNPPFTASFQGFKRDDGPSAVTGLQFSTPAEPSSPPGDYPIVPFGAMAPNYSISFASGTLTIEDIAPEVIPNSALPGNSVANLSELATGAESAAADSATESGDVAGITGLNIRFGIPETGARAEEEELLFSSGGNESFWGPPIPGAP